MSKFKVSLARKLAESHLFMQVDLDKIIEVPSEGIRLYSTEAEILTAIAETEDKEIFQMLDSIVKEEGEKRSKKAQPQKRAIFTSDHLIVTED